MCPKYIYTSFILLIIIFICHLPVFSQGSCQLTLPTETVVLSKTPWAEKLGKNKTYWICNQTSVTFRAGNATIFVDSGSKVTVNHGTYTIYLKTQANLIVNSGAKVQVFYEKGAGVQSTGFSGRPLKTPCAGLDLDLSQAPSNICPTPAPSINETSVSTQTDPGEDPLLIKEDTSQTNGMVVNPYYANLEESHIIPTQAVVIPFTIRIERKFANNQIFWLCENAKMQYSGSNSVIYMEEGSALEVNTGSNNIIFCKKNTKLNLGYGKNHKIFYEEGLSLGRDQSQKTRFTKLMEMEFDYENAPAEGCN